MRAGSNKPYRRSLKNLLLNRRYQLRFTLFMVGITGVLMAVIGWQVVLEAEQTTEVAYSAVMGRPCGAFPQMQVGDDGAVKQGGSDIENPTPAIDDQANVDITLDDDSEIVVPPNYVERIVKGYACRMFRAADLAALRHGKEFILWVLLVVGVVLSLGLAAYGLKMTHRVAGPLYKIGLYFEKMKHGNYESVTNLRKGDQLMEFYEHFKAAHAGACAIEQEALERLNEIVRIADEDALATKSPQLREVLKDIRSLVEERKGQGNG